MRYEDDLAKSLRLIEKHLGKMNKLLEQLVKEVKDESGRKERRGEVTADMGSEEDH